MTVSVDDMWSKYKNEIEAGNISFRSLARLISLIENEHDGYLEFLESLPHPEVPVVGITGAPGSGKSTLTNALIAEAVKDGNRVAVLCVDPSSPFNLGAVLGDRIRMNDWYTHPDVFIRSLASRGALGGLHPQIIEITDLVKNAGFNLIIVETVGVGQSEIEIAGLADRTVVVVVPEGGDEVQTFKAGIMEIADIFVLNKADRPGAQVSLKNLRQMLAPAFHRSEQEIPIIATVASEGNGIPELYKAIKHPGGRNEKKSWLITEKVFRLIQKDRMKFVSRVRLREEISVEISRPSFNLYAFARKFFTQS